MDNSDEEKDDIKFDPNEFKVDIGDDIKASEEESFISHNDIMNFELLVARNIFKDKFDFQKCSQCKSILFRKKTKLSSVQLYCECPLCTNKKKKIIYNFCWMCSRKWQGTYKQNPYCQSLECTSSYIKQNLQILMKCPRKKIGPHNGVPNTRACPTCSQLISHHSQCKHMRCIYCNTNFCFICLKLMLPGGNWQCLGPYDRCPTGVHKRQGLNCLPQPNRITVELY